MKETLRLESSAPEQGGGDSCGREHDHEAEAVLPGASGFNGVVLFFRKKTCPFVEIEKHPFASLREQPRLVRIEAALFALGAKRPKRDADLLCGGGEQHVPAIFVNGSRCGHVDHLLLHRVAPHCLLSVSSGS